MKNKNLLIDIISLVIIVGIIVLAFLALKKPEMPSGEPVILTITVTRNADLIYGEAVKLGNVYFDSTENPVKAISATLTKRDNKSAINIQIESKGKVEKNKIIFNGLRVLIGQKAEIHGNYFAQGVISDVKYQK